MPRGLRRKGTSMRREDDNASIEWCPSVRHGQEHHRRAGDGGLARNNNIRMINE